MNEQLDYIFFFYGFGFIVLAVICIIAGNKKSSLPWTWLGLFGLIHGLNEWLDMLALSMGDSTAFKAVRVCVMALSFACLVEFGRIGAKSISGKSPGRWITLTLAAIGLTGWFFDGWTGLNVFFRYSLGFVGGIWTAIVFLQARKISNNAYERRNLLLIGITFAFYAITCGFIVPKSSFIPASLVNHDSFLQWFGYPVQLLRGMLALISAAGVWLVLGSSKTKRIYRTMFVCSLIFVLGAGWIFTNYSGIREKQEWVQNLQATCAISAASMNAELVNGIDSIEDLENPHYLSLKDRLIKMRESSPEFRYIYLMIVKDGKIIFSADSEPVTSPDYSHPGDEYTDAPAELRSLSRGKMDSATAEYKDRWGLWTSAFVPVLDDETGKPVAILGMDYPQATVQQAIRAQRLHVILITLLIAVLNIVFFYFRERREWFIESLSEAKNALREKEEHLSCTLDSIGDAVIATDCDSRITRMNPVAEQLSGWSSKEARGLPIADVFNIINSETRERAYNPIDDVLSTGNNSELAEGTVIISKDGVERQIADSCSPIRDTNGEVIGAVLVFRDVTEEYRQRELLRDSEARMRVITNSAHDAILMMDNKGLITFWNPAAEQIFGYTNQDAIGKNLHHLITPPRYLQAHLNAFPHFLKTGQGNAVGKTLDLEAVRKDGVEINVQISLSAIQINDEWHAVGILRDITERKLAEEKLKESEARWQFALSGAGDGVWDWNTLTNQIYFSPQWKAMFGYAENEIGDTLDEWEKRVHPDDIQNCYADLQKHFNGETPVYQNEHRVLCKDGLYKWVLDRGKVIEWTEEGKPLRVIGTHTDITERKLSADALRESKARFDQLAEQNRTFNWEVNTKGLFTYVSHVAELVLGYCSDELVGKMHFYDLHPVNEREAFKNTAFAVFDRKESFTNLENPAITKDGDIVWLSTNGIPMLNPDGLLLGYRGSDTDITERKIAEKRLSDSEESYRRQFSENSAMMLLIDPEDGTIISANNSAIKFYGYSKEKLLSMRISDINTLPANIVGQSMNSVPENKGKQFEFQHRLADGSIRDVEVSASRIQLDGRQILHSIINDITARKDAERALADSIERQMLATKAGGVGIWDYNLITNQLTWDDQMYNLYGIKSCDFKGAYEAWSSTVHPDDLKRSENELAMAINGEKDFDTEFRVILPNGDIRNIRALSCVYHDSDGKPVRMIGTNWDITEVKKTESALKDSETNFRTFFNSIDDIMLVGAPDGQIIFANYATSAKLGYSEEELYTMHILDMHPMHVRKEADTIFGQMLKGERDLCPLPLAAKDGNNIPVETRVWFGKWNGEDCIFGISKDLTTQQEAQQRFERLFRNNPASMALSVLPNRTFVDINDAFLNFLGYSRDEVIGKTTTELNIFVDEQQTMKIAHELRLQGRLKDFELKVQCKDGSIKDGIFSGEVLKGQGREYFLTVMIDITERRRMEEVIRESENNQRTLMESINAGIVVVDPKTHTIEQVNHSAAKLIGASADKIIGQICHNVMCPADIGNCPITDCKQNIEHSDKILLRADGTEIPVMKTVSRIQLGGSEKLIETFVDITERKRAENALAQSNAEAERLNHELEKALLYANEKNVELEYANQEIAANAIQLNHQATHDTLTGLVNRFYFEQRLNELITNYDKKKSSSFVVMFLDLDKFKQVNDTLGHKIGDLLLIKVSERLQDCIRAEDVLARMGGDEFTLILTRTQSRETVEEVASRIIDSLSRPFEIQGHTVIIGSSIGLASYPSDGKKTINLLKHADAAMYKAKQSGRGVFCWYNGEDDVDNQQRREIEKEIREALAKKQFSVHYQPIISLENNHIVAAEALLRWDHPKKGMISPNLYIPIAVEMGVIDQIGDYVLRTACAQTAAWRKDGLNLSQIGVNVSTGQIRNANWFNTIESALSDSGLEAKCLNIELSEIENLADVKSLREILVKVRDLGVCVSIEDFNLWQSMIKQLKGFPEIHLKIDGSFIRDIGNNINNSANVTEIIQKTHDKGIKVTAEWVETHSQIEILRSMGCDFAQGYYISPALSAQAFDSFVREWSDKRINKSAA